MTKLRDLILDHPSEEDSEGNFVLRFNHIEWMEIAQEINAVEDRVRPWHNSSERVKRWARKHRETKYALMTKYKDSFNAGAKRSRHDWTQWEIEMLNNEKYTDSQLCSLMQRTMRAIQTKRYRLRKPLPYPSEQK